MFRIIIIRLPILSFTRELSFLYQSTVLSNRAVDGYQTYFGGSVVGKASTTGIEISPTSTLIVTGVKKCEIWRRFPLLFSLALCYEMAAKIFKFVNRSKV